jgi:two-component system, NarL family, response regulator LiaR
MHVRLLIAEDHAVVREGLRMFLRLDADIEVVGEAPDGRQALEVAHALRPDVVLMDLVMPIMDGITATEAIRRELPEVEVVALTGFREDHLIVKALRAGAIGYVLKDTDADSLQRAIQAAAAGQMVLSQSIVTAHLARDTNAAGGPGHLTAREADVLVLIARGRSNKDIARELSIGQQTVKTYVSNILTKLSLQSRTQAALYALQTGMVTTYEPEQT